MMKSTVLWSVIASAIGTSAIAAGDFVQLTDRNSFEETVNGRKLTTLGVSLAVSVDGGITGRAFGKSVTGTWEWRDGYFCRDLNFGGKELASNCQIVTTDGSRIRFISDRGAGQVADLRLR